MADPAGDSLEAAQSSQIRGQGGTDGRTVRRDQGPGGFGGGQQRRHLSKRTQRRTQARRRPVSHDHVRDDPRDHPQERRRPENGQQQCGRNDEAQDRKHHISPSGLEDTGLRQPPHLARVPAQARQRRLDLLPRPCALAKSCHQRFERRSIVWCGCRPEPVIEQLLADRAFRTIESREHGVEVQIRPRPRIERRLLVHREDPVIV